jgi:hypothetical protein
MGITGRGRIILAGPGDCKDRKPFDTASAVKPPDEYRHLLLSPGAFPRVAGDLPADPHLPFCRRSDLAEYGDGLCIAGKIPGCAGLFSKSECTGRSPAYSMKWVIRWQLHRPDSAAQCLDRFQSYGRLRRGRVLRSTSWTWGRMISTGRTCLAAGVIISQHYSSLQKAIIIFSPSFYQSGYPPIRPISRAPLLLTGCSTRYSKKRYCWSGCTGHSPGRSGWLAACDAYRASLSILRYIEKSYDTDDAKLFLKKRNRAVCQGALSVCLELTGCIRTGITWSRPF